jgi:DNA-binding NarL/FixJ family response regulator
MNNLQVFLVVFRNDVAEALKTMLHYLRVQKPPLIFHSFTQDIFKMPVPDLVIFDASFYPALQPASDKWKETKWIALAANEAEAVEALLAGAQHFYLHSDDPEHLPQIIQDVMLHQKVSGIKSIIQHLRMNEENKRMKPGKQYDLTAKEKEILKQLRQGIHLKEIAKNTGNTYETIRTHIKNIYKKLGVNSSAETILIAIDMDL